MQKYLENGDECCVIMPDFDVRFFNYRYSGSKSECKKARIQVADYLLYQKAIEIIIPEYITELDKLKTVLDDAKL